MGITKYCLWADPDLESDKPTIKLFKEKREENTLDGLIIPTEGWSNVQLSIQRGDSYKFVHGNKNIQNYINAGCNLSELEQDEPVRNSDPYYYLNL